MIVQAFRSLVSAGGVGVTSVTATYPILSSGGTTPDISNVGLLQKTVAEMQALATGNQLIVDKGLTYQITNAYSNTAVINIKAFSTSVLYDYGFGTFQNAAMSNPVYCQMCYDLTSDFISRFFDSVKLNDISQNIDGSGGTSLTLLPLDNTQVFDNTLIDCTIGNSNGFIIGSGSFSGVYAKRATIDMINNSNISNCNIYGSVDLGGVSSSSLNTCNIYGTAVLLDNHTLSSCTIGAGKTVDLTNIAAGYSQTGKEYVGNVSTFEVIPADNAAVNPDGGNAINMSAFAFAGILKPDDGSNNLDTFSNFPLDHSWIIAPVTSDIIVREVDNIQLLVAASSPLTISGTHKDWVSFQVCPTDATLVQTIIERIRTP